ncbi:MAG: hypothetical protein EXR79_06230 [Myxococcales bacterium]|nr:hypothetical protein [Myxococcales bacterium]
MRVAIRLFVPALLATAVPAGADPTWQRISADDGIEVDVRSAGDVPFPEFRGHVVIPAAVLEVAAVLEDIDRVCEWTQRCAASKLLRRLTETEVVFYNRTEAPWPASDRDAVLAASVTGLPEGRDVWMRIRTSPFPFPAAAGTVRMPYTRGHYRLTQSERGTLVEFQLQTDIGGWVPLWMVKFLQKRVPHDTLAGLRARTLAWRGRYVERVQRWQQAAAASALSGAVTGLPRSLTPSVAPPR